MSSHTLGAQRLAEVSVEKTNELPDLDTLLKASTEEGFRFVRRLRDEWRSGANRFDRPGEALFLAWVEGRLVGVCGFNRDPFENNPGVGRLRHLYVLPAHRQQGIGRALTLAVLDEAKHTFTRVRLRTPPSARAVAFYRSLGFTQVHAVTATHELALS